MRYFGFTVKVAGFFMRTCVLYVMGAMPTKRNIPESNQHGHKSTCILHTCLQSKRRFLFPGNTISGRFTPTAAWYRWLQYIRQQQLLKQHLGIPITVNKDNQGAGHDHHHHHHDHAHDHSHGAPPSEQVSTTVAPVSQTNESTSKPSA